jgi:steroid 5-alpha reductase family enzyme
VVTGGDPAQRLLVAVLVGVWSTSLALHVYLDRIRGREEEGRCQALRAKWGAQAQSRLFIFFQLQGFGAAVMSLPFLVSTRNDAGLGVWSWVAVAVGAVAVVGEATADRRLAAFRPKAQAGEQIRASRYADWIKVRWDSCRHDRMTHLQHVRALLPGFATTRGGLHPAPAASSVGRAPSRRITGFR